MVEVSRYQEIIIFIFMSILYCVIGQQSVKRCLSANKLSRTTSSRSPATRLMSSSLYIPVSENRQHKYIQLSNGIRAVLVCDPRSEKSSCALGVKAGAAADSLPGLAHMTEHAVFLGSEKFPVENAYKDFLNKNGGGSNGGTGMEHTVYKFYVNAQAFDQALDIFSQFFISPLFSVEAIQREVKAVDAEDSKNRMLDARRALQATKHLMRCTQSDYTKFSTGNVLTLAFNQADCSDSGGSGKAVELLAEEIKRFHSSSYSPDQMVVSMVGPQSLGELEQLCQIFTNIPTKHQKLSASKANHEGQLMNTQALFRIGEGKVVVTHSLAQSVRDLSVLFTMPYKLNENSDYRQPCALLSYLLSNKASNSLFTTLQDKNYITSLSARVRSSFENFVLYEVTCALTTQGLSNYKEIVETVFQYIEKIKNTQDNAQQEILLKCYEDLRSINKLDFHYSEKISAYEYAPYLVYNMLDYKESEEIIAGGSLLPKHVDFHAIKKYFEYLDRDNSFVQLRYHKDSTDVNLLPEEIKSLHSSIKEDDKGYLQRIMSEYNKQSHMKDLIDKEYFTQLVNYLQSNVEAKELSSKEHQNIILTEPYYGVSVGITNMQKLPPSSLNSIRQLAFVLPEKNEFISHNLINNIPDDSSDMYQGKTDKDNESLLRSSKPRVRKSGLSNVELFVSKDEVFQSPKSIAYLHLPVPAIESIYPVELSLLSSMLSQTNMRKYYASSIAGLSYDIMLTNRGVTIKVSGYSEKLPTLMDKIVEQISDSSFWEELIENKELFDNCKDRLLRSLQTWKKERPDQQAEHILNYLLQGDAYYALDLLYYAENNLTIEKFREDVQSVFSNKQQQQSATVRYIADDSIRNDMYTDIAHRKPILYLHQGNQDHDEDSYVAIANKAVRSLVQNAVSDHNNPASNRKAQLSGAMELTLCRQLPADTHTVIALPAYHEQESNSALLLSFQGERISAYILAIIMVLRRIYSEPAFSYLRTQKQLGYIVSFSSNSYGRGKNSIRGLDIRILSKQYSPLTLHSVSSEFLSQFKSQLIDNMSEDTLRSLCANIIKGLQDPLNGVYEEANSFWQEILYDIAYYDLLVDDVIAVLRDLSVKNVQNKANDWVYNKDKKRKSTAVMIFGEQHMKDYQELNERGASALLKKDNDLFIEETVHILKDIDAVKGLRQDLPYFDDFQRSV